MNQLTVGSIVQLDTAPALPNLAEMTPAASAAQAAVAIRAEVRTLVVTGPDIQGLLTNVSADMEIVPTMEIDSDDMATELQTMLGRLSTVSAAIEAERKERGQPLRDALQWLMDGYSPSRDTLDKLIADGKVKLNAWGAAKREAARKAEAAAAEARRVEAAKKAAEEAEAIAKANAAAVEAQALRAAGSEQVAQALETQAMTAVDTARQNAGIAAAALYVAPVRMVGAGVKGASVAWKAECTDKAALLMHIGALIAKGDKSLMDLVTIDPKAINALGKLQKDNLNVPGLSPYQEGRQAIRKVAVAA